MTSIDRNADDRERPPPPDTSSREFADLCRRQARAVAVDDPAGDDILRFIEAVYEWPA